MSNLTASNVLTLERVVLRVAEDCGEIFDLQMKRWQALDEEDLWCELMGCILGSQVSFEMSNVALQRLMQSDLSRPWFVFQKECDRAERQLLNAAKGALKSGYRFPTSRANHLVCSARDIYFAGNSLKDVLSDEDHVRYARRRIIKLCTGIGPKQASLFLRNVGFSSQLAILDTHVMRYMQLLGFFSGDELSISSVSSYEEWENILADYATQKLVNPAVLDIAIWVSMRAWKRYWS